MANTKQKKHDDDSMSVFHTYARRCGADLAVHL